jgi:methionyl-tRNA synthetase
MEKNFYITTPIYYVNAKPHIGHAYTTIAADVLARFHRQEKDKTFFLTGTDEHGLKIQKKAEEVGLEPQVFVDGFAREFQAYWERLDIHYDNFIRTTDPRHKAAVQKVLQTLYDNGAIYKGVYRGLYCVGCEQFKSEKDLVDGKCPDHNIEPQLLEEESYMLKLSAVQATLIEKIKSREFRIAPERFERETLSFLEGQTLEDVSISRKQVSWGIPLPFDTAHTTYVWVDAFLNYLTGLGWDGGPENVPELWPADVQLIGKDILRVHATIWPALLLHLGLSLPKTLFVHGHLLSGGKKMSKTLGNVITIDEMLETFGVEGTKYLLLSAGAFGDDVDITMERLTEKYNADLANGLGNLVARVLKLAEKTTSNEQLTINSDLPEEFVSLLQNYHLSEGLEYVWNMVRAANKYIDEHKPWELAKINQERFEEVMKKLLEDIALIGDLLRPFLPETSEKIHAMLKAGKGGTLFQRIK